MSMNPVYVVITPVRNEQEHLPHTLRAMLAQTAMPREWIIVNDGSGDGTGALIDDWSAQHGWIRPVHRPDRGYRAAGAGVVEAFLDGYRALTCTRWEFLVKLDGDLEFAPDYFAECFARFAADPRLGLAGGRVCSHTTGALRDDGEGDPRFHVRGATKIYRRACWDDIGGIVPLAGWDTIDEMKANMLGWRTRAFRELTLVQHRPTGAAAGAWRNAVKNGLANYNTGYHPLFMLFKCLRRLPLAPRGVGAAGLFWGYFRPWLLRARPLDDPRLLTYVRGQQWRRLTGRSSIYDA